MKMLLRKPLLALVAGSVLASCLLPPSGWADPNVNKPLEDWDEPLPVTLATTLDGNTANIGDPFVAELRQSVCHELSAVCLPSGMLIAGSIEAIRRSKQFGCKGYLVLRPEQAIFPNGITLSLWSQNAPSYKLYHPKAQGLKKTLIRQMPYTALNYALAIPLASATALGGVAIWGITQGAQAVLGSGLAVYDKNLKHRPIPVRMALGVWESTGVPDVYRFIRKSPEPLYQPGDTISLYLPSDRLKALFEVNPTITDNILEPSDRVE